MRFLIFQQGPHIERGVVTVRLIATTLGPDGLLIPMDAGKLSSTTDPQSPEVLQGEQAATQGLPVWDNWDECGAIIEKTVNAYKEKYPSNLPPRFAIMPLP